MIADTARRLSARPVSRFLLCCLALAPAVAVVLNAGRSSHGQLVLSALALGGLTLSWIAWPLEAGAALLVLRPISDVTAHHHASFLGKTATPQQLWGLAFAGVVCGAAWRFRKRTWHRPLVVLVVVLSACGVAGALLGPTTGESLRQWLWVVLALLVVPVGMHLPAVVHVRVVAVVVGAAAVVTCLLVALHPHGDVNPILIGQGYASVSELTGGYASPNELAIPCVALLAWCVVLLLSPGRSSRVLGGATAAGLTAIIVLTTIRTAQLGMLAVGAGAVIVVLRRRLPGLVTARQQAILLLSLAGAAVAVGSLNSGVRSRWLEIVRVGNSRGLEWAGSGRGYLWAQAARDFWGNGSIQKIFGSGFYSDIALMKARTGTTGFAAHNDFLEMLVSTGIVGIALYITILVLLTRQVVRGRRAARTHDLEWVGTLAMFTLVGFGIMSVLTGFIRYTSASVAGLLLLAYVAGWALDRRETPT